MPVLECRVTEWVTPGLPGMHYRHIMIIYASLTVKEWEHDEEVSPCSRTLLRKKSFQTTSNLRRLEAGFLSVVRSIGRGYTMHTG